LRYVGRNDKVLTHSSARAASMTAINTKAVAGFVITLVFFAATIVFGGL
jgi:hypothetical protein